MSRQESKIHLRDTYADAPSFGTEVLHPLLDQGADFYLVGEFVPSYAVSLVSTLVKTSKIEPGKVHLVFGLPLNIGAASTPHLDLARFFSESIESLTSARAFVSDLIELLLEGSLTITLLRTADGRSIAPGCVGLISSRGKGSESVVFMDRLPGDNNSPIHPKGDFSLHTEQQKKNFEEILEVIEVANFTNEAGISRVTKDEVQVLLVEILKKGWLNKFYDQPTPASSSLGSRRARGKKPSDAWISDNNPDRLLDELNRGILNSDLSEGEFVKRYFGKEKQAAFYRFFGLSHLEED